MWSNQYVAKYRVPIIKQHVDVVHRIRNPSPQESNLSIEFHTKASQNAGAAAASSKKRPFSATQEPGRLEEPSELLSSECCITKVKGDSTPPIRSSAPSLATSSSTTPSSSINPQKKSRRYVDLRSAILDMPDEFADDEDFDLLEYFLQNGFTTELRDALYTHNQNYLAAPPHLKFSYGPRKAPTKAEMV